MTLLDGIIGGFAGALFTLLGTEILRYLSERNTAVVALGAELAHNLTAASYVLEKNAPHIQQPLESQWWELVSFAESSWNAVVVSGTLSHLKREAIGLLAKCYAELGKAGYSAEKLQSGRVDPRKVKQYTIRVFDAGESTCKALRSLEVHYGDRLTRFSQTHEAIEAWQAQAPKWKKQIDAARV